MLEDMNLITTHEVADLTGVKYRQIWTYIQRGAMPKPAMHIGNKPLWDKPTIESWASNRRRRTVKTKDK